MHILCVDDDAGLLYLLRSELETHAYEVTACEDGAEAILLLATSQFDAVILDQEMPNQSGMEVIKRAQTIENSPPIIMVTGAGNEAVAVEAIRLGASDYVVKDTNLVYLKILPTVIQQVIQERKLTQRQQAAERAAEVEKERSRLLGQFIRDASHEFRIPLTIIQSSGELLQRLVDEPKPQGYVSQILQQSDRILSLVDHLIQLSRLENIVELALVPVGLNGIIQNALTRKKRLIAKKNLTVKQAFTAGTVTVLADEDELTDAFVELVENACLASAAEGVIQVTLTVENNAAVVNLIDQGVGMTQEQVEHIFDRFYRVDEAHTTPGFGLGLPVVARILELHNATICVTSEAGEGTTVTVTVPLAPQESAH